MATTFVAAAASARRPAKANQGAGLSENYGKYTLLAAFIINDIVQLCKLPANHVPVDLILSSTDLDSHGTPTIVVDVGISDAVGATDDIDAFIDGSDVCQAGGIARMAVIAGRALGPVNNERIVELKVITAPETGVVGTINCTLISRPAGLDD